jgi:hypothetical protein
MNPRRTWIASAGAFLSLVALAAAQVTERMSVDSTGAQGNDLSRNSCISFDGRFVLFESDATNLVSNDTNGFTDVFVHDRLTGTTERVNVDSNGSEATGDPCFIDNSTCISADGRFASFSGMADNLAPGVDTNGAEGMNTFVHDRLTGITEAVDVTPAGICASFSYGGSMSADGRYVAFTSDDSALLPGSTLTFLHTWVRDRLAGTTEIVSVDSSGNLANDSSSLGQYLSADGRFVCFGSVASNLVPGVSGMHAYIHDRLTGTTELVDVDAYGLPSDYGVGPGPMSGDGRFVAFYSDSPNLIGPGPRVSQVFVRDRQTGINTIVSVDSNGARGSPDSGPATISADGRFVSFQSAATNLVADDTNGKDDVFVHDRLSGATTRWDVGPGGRQSDSSDRWIVASMPAISGDGRFVAFEGWGDDLVGDDTNGLIDVFVHGPWLTLEADPPRAAAGATLTFTTWTGDASSLALLAVVDVDGAPMFLPAVSSTFDGQGLWTFSVTVPSDVAGSVWTLRSYGFAPTGKVQASNDAAVAFQ